MHRNNQSNEYPQKMTTISEELYGNIADTLLAKAEEKGSQLTREEIVDAIAESLENKGGVTHNPEVTEERPTILECDVVRFQNKKDKWVALVGILNGYPYEIFTGLQDDDEGIVLPKSVVSGEIIKHKFENKPSRYDFKFRNKRGFITTVEGLSEKFNPEYWNYAKLISGVLRYRMPIQNVIKMVRSLQLDGDGINTWKNGVVRALNKYVKDGTEAKGQICPNCGREALIYKDGNLVCTECGHTII